MDYQPELPPPSFYLSAIKTGQLWLFSDVPVFSERYSSTLNSRPLPGFNTPYISQGAGDGLMWAFQAKLNPFNKFLATEAKASGRDPGSSVYQEYLDILKFVDENGPSPLMVLHVPGRDQMVVALQSISSELALQQDTFDYDGQLPSTIPLDLVLVEVARLSGEVELMASYPVPNKQRIWQAVAQAYRPPNAPFALYAEDERIGEYHAGTLAINFQMGVNTLSLHNAWLTGDWFGPYPLRIPDEGRMASFPSMVTPEAAAAGIGYSLTPGLPPVIEPDITIPNSPAPAWVIAYRNWLLNQVEQYGSVIRRELRGDFF